MADALEGIVDDVPASKSSNEGNRSAMVAMSVSARIGEIAVVVMWSEWPCM
jgi:hypothetical protein